MSGLYTGKYVISPIDQREYCRKNGQFFKHIQKNGFNSYQDFFESFHPDSVQYCKCGNKCSFIPKRMNYLRTCGNHSCVVNLTMEVKNNKTEEEKEITRQKLKQVYINTSLERREELKQQRLQTGYTIGADGLTSYQRSVKKREKTCENRYGDMKYNNSEKISQTKLNWTEEQKQTFLSNLKKAFNGGWMSDYFTDEQWKKRRKKWEQEGKAVPLELLTEWQYYQKQARILTEKNYRHNKHIINPNDYPRRLAGIEGGYHLDHIKPICQGFVEGVSIEDISSLSNLQMLPWHENVTKDRINGNKQKTMENSNT